MIDFGKVALLCIVGLSISACGSDQQVEGAASLDNTIIPAKEGAPAIYQRLNQASSEPQNWLSHGRTYKEQRFSPLTQIDTNNIDDLGLDWFFDLDTQRGQEAA